MTQAVFDSVESLRKRESAIWHQRLQNLSAVPLRVVRRLIPRRRWHYQSPSHVACYHRSVCATASNRNTTVSDIFDDPRREIGDCVGLRNSRRVLPNTEVAKFKSLSRWLRCDTPVHLCTVRADGKYSDTACTLRGAFARYVAR